MSTVSIPTVSIVMPLYNKAPYVGEAIASVLAQTHTDWELWVVDNGSTDGGDRIVQRFTDSRIQLVQSPKQGPGAARNYGLRHATGKWVLFLDADDLIEPDYLTLQLAVAEQNPNAQLIVGGWQEFQDKAAHERILKHPAGYGQSRQDLQDGAIAFVPWAVHATLVRRAALTPDCFWQEELDGLLGEDLVFWFRLISRYDLAYSPCRGALYRIQTPQCRTQNRDVEKWFGGLHVAITHNLKDCEHRGVPLTVGHYEALTRFYHQLYQQAKESRKPTIAAKAHHYAVTYLNQYLAIAPQPKRSMQLRRWLGLHLFSKLAAYSS